MIFISSSSIREHHCSHWPACPPSLPVQLKPETKKGNLDQGGGGHSLLCVSKDKVLINTRVVELKEV